MLPCIAHPGNRVHVSRCSLVQRCIQCPNVCSLIRCIHHNKLCYISTLLSFYKISLRYFILLLWQKHAVQGSFLGLMIMNAYTSPWENAHTSYRTPLLCSEVVKWALASPGLSSENISSLFWPKLDWITSLSPSFHYRPPPNLLFPVHPLFFQKGWAWSALMALSDRFIPTVLPLKCALVSGLSSGVTLFIYAKLDHLWNGPFKASDIKRCKSNCQVVAVAGIALEQIKAS